jgi:hypothetical protein
MWRCGWRFARELSVSARLGISTTFHRFPACCYLIERTALTTAGIALPEMLQNKRVVTGVSVPENCTAKGCKVNVPAGLAAEHLCVMHFTLFVENECAGIRRETALAKTSHERQVEFITKISSRGETLVHVATSGFPMSDELKARVLSTLLTLMNTRENIDRAAMRQSALRRFVG